MIFDMMDNDGYHMMDWWYQTFGPAWWLFMMGWMICIVGLSLIMAYFVHRDAIRRKIPNAEIWLIIVLIFNVIGLLLYLLVRGNYNQSETIKR